MEIEDLQVGPHVGGVAGPSQRHHADVDREPEHNLADRSTVAFGDPRQFGTGQHLAIGSEQREALVNQSVGGAEIPDATIPAADGMPE